MNITTIQKSFGSLFVGLYSWLLAIFVGMIIIDILYANLIREEARATSEVSDFLLGIGFLVLISALVALTFSWQTKRTRNLVFVSLFLVFFEFITPAIFSRFLQNPSGLAIGPWLRIIPSSTASILAFIGMYQYDR